MQENERRVTTNRRKADRRTATITTSKERRDAEQKKGRNSINRRIKGGK